MPTRTPHRAYHHRALSLPAVLLSVSFCGSAYADGPSSQAVTSAVTRAAQADADFPLQGEFVGMVKATPAKSRPVAFQIRAAGEGTFEAAQYMGGFPGNRPPRGEPVRLTGKRTDDYAVLSGGSWVVLVHADHCVLVDPQGDKVGRLERLHRESPTMGAKPPSGAIVLFDGTNTDQFVDAKMTDDGLLIEGAEVKPMFQDFNLHLEFMLPYMPAGRGQGRANSGVYLQRRYEVQILDSFALEAADNDCAALYKLCPPKVNMCFPPLVWQTYDINFTAPRWANSSGGGDGTKIKNARVTVWHNGVKVQSDVELPDKTGAGKPEEPTLLPIWFQDHGNPIRFRNIWLIDRGLAPAGRFPVRTPTEK